MGVLGPISAVFSCRTLDQTKKMENRDMQPQDEMIYENSSGYDAPGRPARRGRITLIAVIALLAIAAFFARDQLLKIRNAEVMGLASFTKEEVLELAGISGSTTYFSLNEEKIRTRINANRYLEFVSLERVWPSGVILVVNERRPAANVLHMGVQYVVSQDGMVLESTSKIALDNGCIKVTGMNVRDIRVGSVMVCQRAERLEAMQELLLELRLQQVEDKVSELNLASLDSIYLVTVDGYTANLGDAQELRAKVGTVRAVVQELRRRGLSGGMIEATVPGQASYRP